MQQAAARTLGMGPGVPGHDQGDRSAAECQGGPHGGVQSVRVHDVGTLAGGAQRGDGGRVTAPRHGHETGPRGGEFVGALQCRGGADGDLHASRDQSGGQRADMGAAARTAAAQHLDRTQL